MLVKNIAFISLIGLAVGHESTPHHTSFCPTSHHTSHCHTSRHHWSSCSDSSSSEDECCHSRRPCCDSSSSEDECCHVSRPCCETKTFCTTIDKSPCQILVCPCPTNTTSFITTTVFVAPTSAAVAPASAAAPVCTPCTSFVTQTTNPPLVCTTMIFCDIVDQSDNCAVQNNQQIEKIASLALRSGGNVFVNGQIVVFKNSNSTSGSSTSVTSGSSLVTVTGLDANDAPAQAYGFMVSLAALGMAAFLMI